MLAPSQAGDIRSIEISDAGRYLVVAGAFLACTTGVQLSAVYAGVKGFMTARSLFLMRTDGAGQIFLASHGMFVQRDLAEGERLVIDNQFIVAFTHNLRYEMVKVASSLRHSFLSGEGFVNRYTGPGTVIFQTRLQQNRGLLRGLFDLAT
jgi:uncharacterized protein (TIGR00266 family)